MLHREFGLVSIIMAAYNAEKTIELAIESVLNQTYSNFELLVINDCSKDGTAKLVEDFSAKDNRVRLISNEKNSGVSFTRKHGLEEANGSWIAILDSDDAWAPEKLEKQIQEEGVEETFKLIGARENPYPIVKKADFFCLLSNFEGYPMVVEEAKILNKFILTTNTATREALIDYAGKSHIVSNSEEGVEEALKFAVKNYKQKDKQNSQYEYKNDRIIGKIEKMIEENSKHPDRVGKII